MRRQEFEDTLTRIPTAHPRRGSPSRPPSIRPREASARPPSTPLDCWTRRSAKCGTPPYGQIL